MTKPHPYQAAGGRVPAAERGYSLIELLASVCAVVVSLALALPALSQLSQNTRQASAQSEAGSALMLARTDAARRGLPASVLEQAAAAGAYARGRSSALATSPAALDCARAAADRPARAPAAALDAPGAAPCR